MTRRTKRAGLERCWKAMRLGWVSVTVVTACGPGGHHPHGAGGSGGSGSGNEQKTIAASVLTDSGAGSLRAAIAEANRSTEAGLRGITIELAPGTHELTLCGDADDTNAAGDLDILGAVPVTLVNSKPSTIHQNCAHERVLDDHGTGTLTVSGITVMGGTASTGPGGGLRVSGDVVLAHATITANAVSGVEPRGGGVYVAGSLRATDSIFSENSASGYGLTEGGGAYVVRAIDITGGSFENNYASSNAASAHGGGLAQAIGSTDAVAIDGTVFTSNRVNGGNLIAASVLFPSGDATGGAVAVSAALHMQNVTATLNSATGGRLAGPPGPTTINGAQPSWIAGGDALGGAIAAAADASFVSSTFTGNSTNTSSTATRTVVIVQCPGCAPSGQALCWATNTPPRTGIATGGAIWVGHDAHLDAVTYEPNLAVASFSSVSICSGLLCSNSGSYPDCSTPSLPPPGGVYGQSLTVGGVLEIVP